MVKLYGFCLSIAYIARWHHPYIEYRLSDEELTDEKVTMRVFGFDFSVHRRLIEFEDSKNPLVTSNCKVNAFEGITN